MMWNCEGHVALPIKAFILGYGFGKSKALLFLFDLWGGGCWPLQGKYEKKRLNYSLK